MTFSCLLTQHPFCSLVDQGITLIFKFYYIRNTLCKVIAAVGSDSSDGSGEK